jgi:hypothetical protein
MKTTKILYWVFTILICGLMLFSAYGTFANNPGGADLAKQIQFPLYIFKFLAVAKILGVIAILVPGFRRLKEWAYAGFFFDLAGATYAFIASGFAVAQWAPMLIFIGLLFGSYITYHKKLTAKT